MCGEQVLKLWSSFCAGLRVKTKNDRTLKLKWRKRLDRCGCSEDKLEGGYTIQC